MLACSAVGTAEQVAAQMENFNRELQPDEFIISMQFYDQAARLKSMELTIESGV